DTNVILREDFELDDLREGLKESFTGTFINGPGIKKRGTLDTDAATIFNACGFGKQAYAFGKSTCPGNCGQNFSATLRVVFKESQYVSSISFREVEIGGNAGSKGEVFIDGEKLESVEFGKRNSFDHTPDTTCRQHGIFIGRKVDKIEFVVSNITNDGELLLDDLVIRGEKPTGKVDKMLIYVADEIRPCQRDGVKGKITLGIIGGKSPISIRWSTLARTLTIDDLDEGIYYVLARDANGQERRLQILLDEYCPYQKKEKIPSPPPPKPPVPEENSPAPSTPEPFDCTHFIKSNGVVFCDQTRPYAAGFVKASDLDWEWSWRVPEGMTVVGDLPTGFNNSRIWLKPQPQFTSGVLKVTATGRLWDTSTTPAKPVGEPTICEAEVQLMKFTNMVKPPDEIRGDPELKAGIVSDFSVEPVPGQWYLWELDPPEFGQLYWDGVYDAMDTILVLPSGTISSAILRVSAQNYCDGSFPVELRLILENPPLPIGGSGPVSCHKTDPSTPYTSDGNITAKAEGLPEGLYRIRITETSGKKDSCMVTLSATANTIQESKGVGKMSLEKGEFTTGEQIKLTYKVSPFLVQQDAWIGLIPSEIVHGTSSLNYQNKVGYKSLRNVTSGVMIFTAPQKEGDYDFRLNNAMNNGFELGSISFRVKKLINTCTRRFYPGTTTPFHPSAPDAADGQIEISYPRLPSGEYTLELFGEKGKLAWCSQSLKPPEEPDTAVAQLPSVPPPATPLPAAIVPDTMPVVRNDTFEITRAGKRISRMFLMDLSDTSYFRLQRKLDSLGSNGWALNKDVTLFGYFVATHDTLSIPPRKEKFRYHVFKGKWTDFVDSANVWGAKGYELTLFNVISGISMKDETTPAMASRQFEYIWIPDFPNAVSNERSYNTNGDHVTDLLNQYGADGWELFMISSEACLLQRIKGNTTKKFEYRLIPMEDVRDIHKVFGPLGDEGWEYCLWAFTFHSGWFAPPFVVKRETDLHPPLVYKFNYAETTGLNAQQWDVTMTEMQNAINDPTVKGWKYLGGLVLDGSIRAFDDFFGMVFMVEKRLK
ncbi:MAG: hypothetical protein JXA23_04205, partial [Bacteroidales bacterium]|nr:hypothetical protein [Bacteroidales bacterium]